MIRRVDKSTDTFEERFFKNVEKVDGCWEWLGCIGNHGYGQFDYKKVKNTAHRASYKIHKGEIAKGLCVCHTCDNRKCVNTAHLYLGDSKQNTKDMWDRKRNRVANGGSQGFVKPVITADEAREIKALVAQGVIQQTVAEKFNINQTTVSRIALGKITYHADQGEKL